MFESQAARDAERIRYGDTDYWTYLDRSAREMADYYIRHGEGELAQRMLYRSLSEALTGNDGI